MNIGAYISICEEDVHWTSMFLKEIERLNMPFAMYFDRCSDETKHVIATHPLCIGYDCNDNPKLEYDEKRKEITFQRILKADFEWAIRFCPDEIFEDDAISKFEEICKMDVKYVTIKWVNMWEDYQHIRIDGPFGQGTRSDINNLRLKTGYKWEWTNFLTYGCILSYKGTRVDDNLISRGYSDLVCLHAGLMTHELRVQHKERWDRIYTHCVGKNPYGFWNYSLDYIKYPPVIVENSYLKRQICL